MSTHYIENTEGWKVGDIVHVRRKKPYTALKTSASSFHDLYRSFNSLNEYLKDSSMALHVTRIMDDGMLECEEVKQ